MKVLLFLLLELTLCFLWVYQVCLCQRVSVSRLQSLSLNLLHVSLHLWSLMVSRWYCHSVLSVQHWSLFEFLQSNGRYTLLLSSFIGPHWARLVLSQSVKVIIFPISHFLKLSGQQSSYTQLTLIWMMLTLCTRNVPGCLFVYILMCNRPVLQNHHSHVTSLENGDICFSDGFSFDYVTCWYI